MEKSIFINDVHILNQSIRGIHYTTKFGEDFHFDEIDSLDISCSYDIYTHKENKRDHLVVIELSITEIDKDSSVGTNQFHMIVEGHYLVNATIDDVNIDQVKHFGSLSNLLSFLRTAVHNITSLSMGGTFHLPLISVKHLHENRKRLSKKKVSIKKKRM